MPIGVKLDKPETRVIIDHNENSDTTIILFGWAGCQDRYLAKYADFYQSSGYSTVRFTVPIAKVRSFSSYHYFANIFYRELLEKEGCIIPANIYFHLFSMNGCSTFSTFWDLLDTKANGPTIKKRSRGIIFDSSPAYTSPSQSAHAVSFATFPPSFYHSAVRESYKAILFTFFSIHRGVMWLRSLIETDVYEKNYAYFRLLALSDLPVKQLYLYGPGDEVCSADSIESFASEMERRGAVVNCISMEESLHCQHLRTYPKEYISACFDFVKTNSI